MKKIILIYIAVIVCLKTTQAQILFPENTSCTAVCLDATKNSISGRMPNQNNLSPNNFLPCGSGTSEDNPTWFVFYPSQNTITFNALLSDCKAGGCGGGLSMTIWEEVDFNCNNLTAVNCEVGSSTSLTFTTNVTPAKAYYLQLDGLCEAQCSVVLNYDKNQLLKTIDKPVISGATSICKAKNQKYAVSFANSTIKPESWKWALEPATAGYITKIPNSDSVTIRITSPLVKDKVKLSVEPVIKSKCALTIQKETIELTLEDCNCIAQAGVMELLPLLTAKNSSEKVSVAHKIGSESYKVGETFAYVLHEGNSDKIVNPIASNQSGIFGFDVSKMKCNQIYYVSYVVGTTLNGLPNPVSSCYKTVPKGQPVTWIYQN